MDIEREVELGGPIHSKGVMILTGYIGNKYGRRVPLSLSCSVTFEQSYDEVEGDSASVAELMAILLAIVGVPIRQDLAITGSLDQLGNVQPVGRIKEKVEGFWRICKEKGFSKEQGVVLPSKNADNLVLEEELIEDIKEGSFHLYLVDTIDDVIEVATDIRAEKFHRLVMSRLRRFSRAAELRKRR